MDMDKNQQLELGMNGLGQNRGRSRGCCSRLSAALDYAKSKPSYEKPVEQSLERSEGCAPSPRRVVTDTLSPGRVVADTLSLGRSVVDTLSSERSVDETLSPRRVVADTLSSGRVVADTLSPGRLVARRAVAGVLSQGKAVSVSLSQGGKPANTSGQAVLDTRSPGKTGAETRGSVANTLSPDRETPVYVFSIDKFDQKRSNFRNSSKSSSQVYGVPRPHKLVSERSSTLSSSEPLFFTSTYRGGTTPSPFRATPLSPIKTSHELKKHAEIANEEKNMSKLDTWKEKENKFQAHWKKKEEDRQRTVKELEERGLQVVLPHQMKSLALKLGKENGLKAGSLIRRVDHFTSTTDNIQTVQKGNKNIGNSVDNSIEQNIVRESQLNLKADLTSHSKLKNPRVRLSEANVSKSSSRTEVNIVKEKENKFQAHWKNKELGRQRTVKELEERGLQDVLPHQMKALALKLGNENGLKAGSLIRFVDHLTSATDNIQAVQKGCKNITKTVVSSKKQNISTESHPAHKIDIKSHSKLKNQNFPFPKAPCRPKVNIVVRETKASRLRRNKLQMQGEKSDATQRVLPSIKAQVNHPTLASIATTHPKVSLSPLHSRSSSESPPPTPVKLKPSRPDFVPRLDLSGLLSPDYYPEANQNQLAPRDTVVWKTKASKLLPLKQMDDEMEVQIREDEEPVQKVAFEQPMGNKVLPRKVAPKPCKIKELVIIKETIASRLSTLKEEENNDPPKDDKTQIRPQNRSQRQRVPDTKEIDLSWSHMEKEQTETPMPKKHLQTGFENGAKNTRLASNLREFKFDCSNEKLSENASNQLTKKLTSSGSINYSKITARQVQSAPTISRYNRHTQTSFDVNEARPFKVKEQTKEKEREAIDESSVRNRKSRLEIIRGLKVRKEIRLAMEEDEKKWQSDLGEEYTDVEGAFVFGKPEDNNREIITKELNNLKEHLEVVEAADKNRSKSKVMFLFNNKVRSHSKNKKKTDKYEKEIETITKEREERIDEYFRSTAHSLNSVLGDIWERFIYQQDSYCEMLKRITLQEKMLEKWKSKAKYYRFMHTMLKDDYLGECKESWYLGV